MLYMIYGVENGQKTKEARNNKQLIFKIIVEYQKVDDLMYCKLYFLSEHISAFFLTVYGDRYYSGFH